MGQKNYFNDLISNDEHFYDMPDCISECADYKDLIEKSFGLTAGQLNLDSFKCYEQDNKYLFELSVNQNQEKFAVNKISDYVDAKSLILGLNLVLKNNNIVTNKRFIELVGGPVDFGIAFISIDKEMNLAKNGLIWRDKQFYIDFENAKGENKNEPSSKTKPEISKPSNESWWKIW